MIPFTWPAWWWSILNATYCLENGWMEIVMFIFFNNEITFEHCLMQDRGYPRALTMELPQYINGLVQDCRNSIVNALELLQSCTKPSICTCWIISLSIQYIPRNMHTVFALLCFAVVIHWLIFPYPSGLLHWHCGNLMIAPEPAKQPWWIWINTSCEFIMNDCITTTKQSTTKPCAYFLGYTVHERSWSYQPIVFFYLLAWPLD